MFRVHFAFDYSKSNHSLSVRKSFHGQIHRGNLSLLKLLGGAEQFPYTKPLSDLKKIERKF